ncbi:MAG: Stk1 family PASTA domain-containing Ser/Thr kinase [Acidimicrobiales bacterium]|jgi:serine/threonine-protein kinase|nr:Stk1 family PASTA domain-containing Ser/Thr kinase [Acidimicrobiales bacterium]
MSDVYLARDLVLDRPVAVKVLFPEYAKDESFVERFRREARAAAKLTHPNIVSIYDWGEELDTYFIAMEYVEGRSLAEIIRAEGALPPRRAAEIAADVASALGFAHRNGVVHRDVKPGNVMIDSAGHVKVADFGIAQAFSGSEQANLTKAGSVMGTATYFSPEQAQGRPVDPRSDLYSLGVVLFEMVVGRAPFQGDTPVAIAYKHVQEQPPLPETLGVDVPPPLEAIDMKLLAKDPAQRYESAEELRTDLRRFLDGQRVSAPPVGYAASVAAAAAGTATQAVPAATAVSAAPPRTPTPATGPSAVPYAESQEPRRRTGWFVVALVVLLAAIAGALVYIGANLDDDDVAQLTVPPVRNKSEADATTELEAAGFKVTVKREANDQVEAGIVFAQDPPGGSTADEGSVVTISVSAGLGDTEVPDVIGQAEASARSLLENSGFVVETRQQADDVVPKGTVISQNPNPGEMYEKGSKVTIVVSSGKRTEAIPPLAGQSATTASNTLGQLGFTVATLEEFSSVVPDNVVIRTDPPAGTQVEVGSSVTIVVSKGPQPTTSSSTTSTSSSSTTSTSSSSTSSTSSSTSSTSSSVPASP